MLIFCRLGFGGDLDMVRLVFFVCLFVVFCVFGSSAWVSLEVEVWLVQ